MGSRINYIGTISITDTKISILDNAGMKQLYWQELSDEVVEDIIHSTKVEYIQISSMGKCSEQAWKQLDKVFAAREDIIFRVFGFYGASECDFSFLRELEHLKRLCIDCINVEKIKNLSVITEFQELRELRMSLFDLRDYSFIQNMPLSLEKLSLFMDVRSGNHNFDCAWLAGVENLHTLYLGKARKNIAALKECKALTNLKLRGIKLDNTDFLREMPLKELAIHWCTMQNLDIIEGHPTLQTLELWRVQKLTDLEAVSTLKALEKISMQDLANVEKLPDLSNQKYLKTVYIGNLKVLRDISSLGYAPGLQNIEIHPANSLTPEAVKPVFENKALKRVWCSVSSMKKNEEIKKMIADAGIENARTEN